MKVPLTAGLFMQLHFIVAVVVCPKLLCSVVVEVFLQAWCNPSLTMTASKQWQSFSHYVWRVEMSACVIFAVHVNLLLLQGLPS